MFSNEMGAKILFTVLITSTVLCNGTVLDTKKLKDELFDLAYNGLGVQKMQDHFDSLSFRSLSLSGDDIVSEMELAIRQKVLSTVQALENIREAVEKSFEETEIRFTPCCEIADNLEFNTAFGKSLDTRIGCTRIADNADPNPRFLSNEVIDVMKENSDSFSNLKWQYFGSEEGVFTIYPASLIDDCDNYDHRFRPWYVEAATPEPKDVVIVIDTSGSMSDLQSGKSLIAIAIDASITVLDTMNPNDKVGVVAFSSIVKLPPMIGDTSCYANELALSTTINIQNLKKFVLSLTASGGTNYGKAFEAAFNLLKASYTPDVDIERDQVIIFLTDGEPTDTKASIMSTIRSKNEEMENKVTILTFGLGSDSGINFLQDIANQNFVKHGVEEANISIGETKQGVFTHVTDYNLLRSKMARYYDYFANFDKLTDEPIFSVPYQDSFGLGMMTTAAVPVKYNHVLKGVVGVDITLTDLLEEVTFFTGGQNSYALVFDVDTYAIGRTLLHPLLPSPLVIEDEPVYVHITSLEREQEFYDRVYNYATNDGTFGNATFTSRRYISRGNQRTEGVNKMSVLSTYHWRRVIGSNYIVCLVEAVDFDVVELFGQGPKASADDFVYHRLDIVPPDTSCKYVNRLATKEQSTVKFAPRAFSSPAQYLQYEETESIVEQYQNYMMDASSINTHFKDRVRDAVIVTAKVNEIWKSEDADMYKHYTLFRYMGTRNGVYRQLPGITMSKVHDTTVRPWYERAKSNADILTLSVPYADANGAGEVIALSKAITESLSSTSTSSNVLAVMGMDFTISYFYNMLTKHYPECEEFSNSCFVMDSSGFLVIHRDFTESDSDVSDIHIMEKEPNVAEDLLEKRILKKKQCVDFQKIKNLNYYIAERVGSTATIDNMNNANKCKRYRLAHVQDTNVYLGIVYKATGCNQHCPCYYETCMHTSADNECECPCLSPTEYEYCKDQFSFTSDDDPTCLPPRPSISPVIEDTDAYTGLGECYNANCTSKQAASECNAYVSCKWNKENGACVNMFLTIDDDASNNSSIVIIVIIVIVLILVVIVFSIILVLKFKPGRQKSYSDNNADTVITYDNRAAAASAPPIVPQDAALQQVPVNPYYTEMHGDNQGYLVSQQQPPPQAFQPMNI